MSTNEQIREENNGEMEKFGAKLKQECAKLGFGCIITWDREKSYKGGAYEFNFELNRHEGVPLSDAENPAPQVPDKIRTVKGSYAISFGMMGDRETQAVLLARKLLILLDKERREEFVMGQYEKLSTEAKQLLHHACNENHATLELRGYYDEKRFFSEIAATTLVHTQEMPFDVTIFPTGDGRLVHALLEENKAKKKGRGDGL